MILLFLGRIVDAREAIERALSRCSAQVRTSDRMAARAAGQDAGVAMQALMSWVLWVLGACRRGGHTNGLPRLNAPTWSTMRTRTLTPGTMRLFCMLCAASRQLLKATRSAVSPYRSNTDSASGSDCRARSEASARPALDASGSRLDEVSG